MAGRIREYDAKRLLQKSGALPNTPQIIVHSSNSEELKLYLDELPQKFPWLLECSLVAKPDVLLKRRGQQNLICLNTNWSEIKEFLMKNVNKSHTVSPNLSGQLSHFIVEPYISHPIESEFYFAIRTLSHCDEILFSCKGGIDVGDVESHAQKLQVPLNSPHEPLPKILASSLLPASYEYLKDQFDEFVEKIYAAFCNLHFTFLEMNPIIYNEKTSVFMALDAAAKLDSTAEYLCQDEWGKIEFPSPFGRIFSPEETAVKELDATTGASLKLTVINPNGRIWTMIAGGGASVIFADTICEFGLHSELANYGEYSGAPSENATYSYAKTILSLVTAEGTYREEGKCLIIAGGIANFTSIVDTFKGIISALKDFKYKLHDYKVKIFVRRGGPNYQDGLKMMREVGEQLDLPIRVFGPETYMTEIINLAFQDNGNNLNLEDSELEKSINKITSQFHMKDKLAKNKKSPLSFNYSENFLHSSKKQHIDESSTHPSISDIHNMTSSEFPSNESQKSLLCPPLNAENRQHSWHETHMEDIEKDPRFVKKVKDIIAEQSIHRESHTYDSNSVEPKKITSPEYSNGFVNGHKIMNNGYLRINSSPWFTTQTKCFVWGLQTRAVQEMLDFDHVCGRTEPSVAAIIYEFSVSHLRPFYFGTEEIFIPVCQTLEEAVTMHGKGIDVLVNFASFRSATSVIFQSFDYKDKFMTVATIAEGIPERLTRQVNQAAKKHNTRLIGPATVGGIKPGAFRIGNTGGTLENIMNAKLYRAGSVGLITKSGGMLNELNNVLSQKTDGVHEAIAIGGDRYPGTSMLEHALRFQEDSGISIIVVLGEVGGNEEYLLAEAISKGRISKPVVAWCVGTCAPLFSTEVAFGHAGAWANGEEEHAHAKNQYLRRAGAVVPLSFHTFGDAIEKVYKVITDLSDKSPLIEPDVPRVPMDYAWAKKLGLVRKPKGFVSSISDDRGEELLYAGWPVSKVVESGNMGVGGVISLLWFKRPLPEYCYRYLERILMLTADHGPAVCGAHNAIVTARAGKDLISSLISGLCTIGDRFGGACDKAAHEFLSAYRKNISPEEFVKENRLHNKLIMGIGHKIKSVNNPDMRVELLRQFCETHFKKTDIINYAKSVEKITTRKKSTLILNVDGLIGASMCDMLFGCGAFSEIEAIDYIENGCINGLFVLGRSIGFIGHYLDQKRLKQGLYRHDVDDISYVLPDFS